MQRARFLPIAASVSAVVFALSGCGTADVPSVACVIDDDCSNGSCIGGTCVESDTTTPDAVEFDTTDEPEIDDTVDDTEPDVADAVDTDATDADAADVLDPGSFGAPCITNSDCDSGYCIGRGDARVCTEACLDSCPDGWSCRLLENATGDVVQICVPVQTVLCTECDDDFDCGGINNLCIPQRDGTFCGTQCATTLDCPEGYLCDDFTAGDGSTIGQCVPSLAICGDCLDEDGDLHGFGPGCLGTDCNDLDPTIYEGAAELCDGIDNNCDRIVDDGFNFTNDNRHCGGCGIACVAPNASGPCVDSVCELICDTDWHDANNDPRDGCELACVLNAATEGVEVCNELDDNCDGIIDNGIDLTADASNCGACGNVCASAGAEVECFDSECRIADCAEPYADCDALLENGCEANLLEDSGNCGLCGIRCDPANAIGGCDDGFCAIFGCDDGYADCDGLASNGCEVNLLNNINRCGTCTNACSAANGRPICTDGVCEVASCTAPWADCNEEYVDGCEIDLTNSVDNCGFCDRTCTVANGNPFCDLGACAVDTCLVPYGDCNELPGDGCEVNMFNSLEHCGSCGNRCVLPNAETECDEGVCTILRCVDDFADCDGDPTNGCEVNTQNSVSHCGVCDTVCTVTDGVAACNEGVCEIGSCNADYDDCDGDYSNGCEEFLRFNTDHCGVCDRTCGRANSVTACNDRTCIQLGCDRGFDDCNGLAIDGCETDIFNTLANCGACDSLCTQPNGAAACIRGVCQAGDCAAGFGDCNLSPVDGCETSLTSNNNNCGACGNNCISGFPNGRGTCGGLACQLTSCNTNFDDCDDNPANGCETDLRTNNDSCGACGNACVLPNAIEACGSSTCNLLACEGVYDNCDGNPVNGCEINTNTNVNNCGTCGVRCSYPNAQARCNLGTCAFNGCLDGFYNFDGNTANGCEYACTPTSTEDAPDVAPFGPGIGVDANCDGVDGVALQSVFVLPGSSLANPGTMALPVPTITRAIEIASGSATRRNILVAAGTYNEAITLPAGVNLYGGYTRVNNEQWTRAVRTTSPTVIQSPTRFGMNFSSIAAGSPTRVQNVVIVAAAASVAGESSYGVRLQNSPGVTIEHSTVQAGSGAAGSNGTSGNVGSAGGNGTAGTQGCDGCDGAGWGGGGGGGPCGAGGGSGGRGGYGSSGGSGGATGGGPSGGAPGGGGSGRGSDWCVTGCNNGGTGGGGQPGGTAANGSSGAAGSRTGAIASGEWRAGAGGTGTSGGTGSGGGGAGGGGGTDCCLDDRGGGGGGGGGGGCGGTGGNGGNGGGGSIAVLSIGSAAVIRNSTLVTANGGVGGNGASGGGGGAGGAGGVGGARADNGGAGGRGGDGSRGGTGGCGGGGAGGAAIGILSTGTAPSQSGITFTLGLAGGGGGGCGNAGQAGDRTSVANR